MFRDDFRSGAKNWSEDIGSDYSMKIADGYYEMEKRHGNGGIFSFHSIPLRDEEDWSVEASLRLMKGDSSRSYGLAFRSLDADTCYIFSVNDAGYASVIRLSGTSFVLLIDRRPFHHKSAHDKTTLRIEHSVDVLAFYVDSECIGSLSASETPEFGDRFGFYVDGQSVLRVESVIARAQRAVRTINPISDGGLNISHVNLGPHVNSAATEMNPLISADGSTLYFSRRNCEQNMGEEHYDDIWFSKRSASGEWQEAQNIGAPINNDANNAVVSVAPDNNTLLLQGRYAKNGEASGPGISISHRIANGWSKPKNIRIDSLYNLNRFMEFCLSPDGTVLVSSIERFDTKGSKDLYVSFRTSDTSFSVPKHIAALSTVGSDNGPFVASDGSTMYFSTNGRAGYGSEDIYVTTRLDSTWLHWSEPRNLGPHINTPSFDGYFHTTARGDSAYLMTYVSQYGEADIVRIVVPPEARPKSICLISGHVFDSKTHKALGADVEYQNLATNLSAGFARSNPSDGAYNIVLPGGTLYGFHAEAENYYPVSEQLDTRGLAVYQEITKDLYLVPIEKEATIRLNNLFFDFAKSELRPESADELNRLTDFMLTHPTIHIQIAGHTDSVGDNAKNLTLSRSRATAVMSYLRHKGIAALRLRCVGYGSSKPIQPNDTDEGRQQNRRVEFIIESN